MTDIQTAASSKGLLCPVCRVDLAMSDRQGIEIDYCPKCRGVWLDRGELDKIIERNAAYEDQASPGSGAAGAPLPQSPSASAPAAPPAPYPQPYPAQGGYDPGYYSGGHGSRHGGGHGGGHGSFLGRLFR